MSNSQELAEERRRVDETRELRSSEEGRFRSEVEGAWREIRMEREAVERERERLSREKATCTAERARQEATAVAERAAIDKDRTFAEEAKAKARGSQLTVAFDETRIHSTMCTFAIRFTV